MILFSKIKLDRLPISKIQNLCKQAGATLSTILTVPDANKYRRSALGIGEGVWYVDPEFARGFDLKFQVDALVVILDSAIKTEQVNLTEAR